MEQMMENNSNTQANEQNSEQTPIDGIISRVDSYIKDPKLVTPQTLQDLKNELMDLKSYLDSEEQGEPQNPADQGNNKKPMLTVMIGMHKKQGGQ